MLDVDVTAVVLPVVLVTAIQLVYWMLHSISVRKPPSVVTIERDIAALQSAITKLSPVRDFVEVSKKQRAVLALEKNLAEHLKAAAAKAVPVASASSLVTTYVQPAIYILLVAWFWRVPVATFRSEWFAPFAWALRSPGHGTGTISILAWVSTCHTVLAPTVKQALQLSGVISPPEEVGLVQRLMSMVGLNFPMR